MILVNLDGWRIGCTSETLEIEEDISPFITEEELPNKANKIITDTECKLFYEEALDLAYMHTNRLNIDDLSEIESKMFIRAVCKWTASNLWNKYNIRVTNEDLEDTYIQSYGGLLYHSAMKSLQPFINQRITRIPREDEDNENDSGIWVM